MVSIKERVKQLEAERKINSYDKEWKHKGKSGKTNPFDFGGETI